MRGRNEGGFVFVVLVASIIPMMFLASAAIMTMTGRNSRLIEEVKQERAFWAAESGIDEAIYLASIGMLKDGVSFSRQVGNQGSFTVQPTLLLNDGQDNDGDTLVDEGDENVFRLMVTGKYRGAVRRLVAYMGPTPGVPALDSAVSIQGIPKEIEVEDGSVISGFDVTPPDIKPLSRGQESVANPAQVSPGTAPSRGGSTRLGSSGCCSRGGGGAGVGTGMGGGVDRGGLGRSRSHSHTPSAPALVNQPGLKTISSEPATDLGMALKISSGSSVQGVGGSPSLAGNARTLNLTDLVTKLRSVADVVLTKKDIKTATNLGDASQGDYKVIFRNGDLELETNGRGAGILVVTGKLEIEKGFRFDGLVIAMGKLEIEKGSVLNGGAILGPPMGDINEKHEHGVGEMKLEVEHQAKIQYSSEILRQVGYLLPGRYVVFNGWQEVSRS